MVMRAVKQAVSLPVLSATIGRELRDALVGASWVTPASVNEWLAVAGSCLPGTLLLLSGGLGAKGEEGLIPAAVAMELIVLARQVREDAHREFLYARALATAATLPPFVMEALAEVMESFAMERIRETTRGLGLAVTEEQYLEHVYAKSGLLLATCGQLGARLCSASVETVEALTMYGFALGMAVQIGEDMGPRLRGRGGVPRSKVRSLTRRLQPVEHLSYADTVLSTYIGKARASLSVLPPSASKTALLDLLSTLCLDLEKE